MTFGSLFAGIGGMDLGLERAGLKCRWQIEKNEFCRQVLAKHWPDIPRFVNVEDINGRELEWVDCLAGGFPCQDISYAGPGDGLAGTRSGLWSHFARFIREMGPRVVLVENVAALLTRGMGEILGTLSSFGYDAEWSVVSACSMGATHMRRRVFIVAYANSIHGRQGLRDFEQFRERQVSPFDSFASNRACQRARLENPSELYRGADDASNGMDRNRAIGNSVYPDVAEWIGQRIMAVDEMLRR